MSKMSLTWKVVRLFMAFLLFMVFSHHSFAQNKWRGKNGTGVWAHADTNSVRPVNNAIARFEIEDMRTRGVIVRIKTDRGRIQAYRKEGYKKVADKLEDKLRSTSLLLRYAFVTHWSYSPVYFMESQNTDQLLNNDRLIAYTSDFKRDTSIYMNRDSFYMIDLGDLMTSTFSENHPTTRTSESNNSAEGVFLVVKDHEQKQLQNPMPYEAKLWLEELTSTDKMEPLVMPGYLKDSFVYYSSLYPGAKEIMKSAGNSFYKEFMDRTFSHIRFLKINSDSLVRSLGSLADYKPRIKPDAASCTILPYYDYDKEIKGNAYQDAARRLNKQFIAYFCKHYDKDRNIIYNDNPYYWWLRNPNIRYLPNLHDLEVELKLLLDKDPSPTK